MKEISLHDAVRMSALGARLSQQQVEVLAGLVRRETFTEDIALRQMLVQTKCELYRCYDWPNVAAKLVVVTNLH